MAKTSTHFRSDSLKGKTHLATTALAVFIVFFGLISYSISLLFGNSFYAVFIPFLFLASAVVFFGFWLSNEIAAPVERVSLLAKSYERGVSTSVPKTSGSVETDELAQGIARLGGQVQKLIASMDEAAAGNLDAAFSSNASSDRTSQSFQRLLAKVSESIHVKQDFEELQNALHQLREEISMVKSGKLEATIETETEETREISETLNYLIQQLNEIVGQVRTSSVQVQSFACEVQKNIQVVVERSENNVQEMNQAAITLKQVPIVVQKISKELSQSSLSASQSIERAQNGNQIAQENLKIVGDLRRRIQEAIKHIQRLDERSQEISRIAKAVEDLSERAKMIGLNAAVRADDTDESERSSFIVLSKEIDRLAERAQNTNKDISSLNKIFKTEIAETEKTLTFAGDNAAAISKCSLETGIVISEFEKYAGGVLSSQNNIISYSKEQAEEAEKAFQVFVNGISETQISTSELKKSANGIVKISALSEDLQCLVADFKTASANVETDSSPIYTECQVIEDNVSAYNFGEKS